MERRRRSGQHRGPLRARPLPIGRGRNYRSRGILRLHRLPTDGPPRGPSPPHRLASHHCLRSPPAVGHTRPGQPGRPRATVAVAYLHRPRAGGRREGPGPHGGNPRGTPYRCPHSRPVKVYGATDDPASASGSTCRPPPTKDPPGSSVCSVRLSGRPACPGPHSGPVCLPTSQAPPLPRQRWPWSKSSARCLTYMFLYRSGDRRRGLRTAGHRTGG